jgi:heme-degrading monooxygenase HmoA
MVIEVVMYRVAPDRLEAFKIVHKELAQLLQNVPGFISIESVHAIEDSGLVLDRCLWESYELAAGSKAAFFALPSAAAMMDLIDRNSLVRGLFPAD